MSSLVRATRRLAICDETGLAEISDPMEIDSPNDSPESSPSGSPNEDLCECYHALAEVMFDTDFGAVVGLIRQYRFSGAELTKFAAAHGDPGIPAVALLAAEAGQTDRLHFFFSRGGAAPPSGPQLPPPRALNNECLYRAAVGGHLETVEYLLEPLGGGLTAKDAVATLARIRETLGDDPPELWKRPDIYSLLDQK